MSSIISIISEAANMESILQITNYVLIGLFVAIIVGIVLAIVAGLIRGVFSSTFRMLFMLTLIIIAIALLNPTIDAVGNFDIAGFSEKYNLGFNMFVNISNPDSGLSYYVPVTTVYDTLSNSIAAAMHAYEVPGSSKEIADTAWALTTMIVKYGVLLVDMLLIIILGYTFSWILWHLCFKHIVPIIMRKAVKIRWLAAIEEVVTYVVVGGLFLAPLTSIVNIANQSWQNTEHDETNEIVQTVNGFVNQYNDSLFAKTLFNWTVNDDGLTLDAQFIDYVTKTVVGEAETSLSQTLSSLANIGSLILNSVTDPNGQNPINLGYVLSEKTLTSLFSSINKSQVFTYLLPIVATVAMNLDVVANYIDPKLVEISDIEWMNEIKNIQTVAIDLTNSGILSSFIDENGNPLPFGSGTQEEQKAQVQSLIDNMLSSKAYPYFERILYSIDNSKLLSRVIPALLMSISESNPDLADMLPKTWEEMNTLKWGAELNIVYNSLFRLNNSAPELVTYLIEQGFGGASENNEPVGPVPSAVLNAKATPEEEILNLIVDNLDPLISVLIGEFDENGNLVNVDEDGYTKVFENGHRIANRYFTLMDSNLFSYLIPNVLDLLVSNLSSGDNAFIAPETLQNALKELNSGKVVKNYKSELGALFTAVRNVVKNDALKDLIFNAGSSDPMEMLKNQSLVDSVVDLLPIFDRSLIFNSALKPFLIDTVKGQGAAFEEIGLSVDSFNFETEDFTGQIAHLLKAMPTISYFMDLTSKNLEGSALFSEIAENVDKIALLLDVVFESDIFNPHDDFFDGDRNNNFFTVLGTLFGTPDKPGMVQGMVFDVNKLDLTNEMLPVSTSKGEHKWTNTKDSNGNFIKDCYGHPIFDGETGFIANIIANLGVKSRVAGSIYEDKTLFDAFMGENPTQAIGYLESDFKISNVFASIDDSTLFSSMFGPFLDSLLDDPSIGIVNHDQKQGFTYVTSWTKEGKNFANVCNSIKNANIDLMNLDISKFDEQSMPHLNAMLHSLADSQMFGDESGRFTFNAFLYTKLESALAGSGQDMLADAFTGKDNIPVTHVTAMQDFGVKYKNIDGKDIIVNNPETSNGAKDAWVDDTWMSKFASLDKAALEKAASTDPNFYDSDYISSVCKLLVEFSRINKKINESSSTPSTGIPDIAGALTNKTINSKDLSPLLLTMNDVDPFRIVLYNAINSVSDIVILPASSGFGEDVTLKEMNAEFFIDDVNFTKAQRAEEITRFLDIYDILMNVLDNNEGKEMTQMLTDVNNVVRLKDVVAHMNRSYLFHRAGYARINGLSEDTYTHTMFQTVLENFVMSDAIEKFFYVADSPKDKAATEYNDLNSKKEYMLQKIYDVPTSEERVDYQVQQTSIILEILSALSGGYKSLANVELRKVNEGGVLKDVAFIKGTDTRLVKQFDTDGNLVNTDQFYYGLVNNSGDPTIDIDYIDYNDIKGVTVADILNCFNNSDLLYDCAPNVLGTLLTQFKTGDTVDDDIFSKSLAAADPYYIYTIDSSTPDYNKRFFRKGDADRLDRYEFNHIAKIVDIYLELGKIIEKTPGKSFADLLNGGLAYDVVDNVIKPLLCEVKDTFILHRADINGLSEAEIENPKRNLTAYENLVYGFFDETNITTMLPGSALADKQAKMKNTIKHITYADIQSGIDPTYVNETGLSNSWDDEINSLFDFVIDISKFSGGDISGFEFSLTNKNLSPDNIQNLLYKFNSIDTCEGVLSELFKTTLSSAGFDTFASYEGNTYANYDLTRIQFGVSKPEYGDKNEINTLTNLLRHLSVEVNGVHDSYITLDGSDITKFVSDKGTSGMLLEFIDDSYIYENSVTLSDLNTKVNLKSVFFYNIIESSGLESFIAGNDHNDKIRLMNQLMFDMTKEDGTRAYDPSNEARSLDRLIKESTTLLDPSQFKSDDINSIKAMISTVNKFIVSLSNTFDEPKTPNGPLENVQPAGRSYLSSEILSNILQDLVDAQTSNIIAYSGAGRTFDQANLRFFKADSKGQRIQQTADNKATWYKDLNYKSYDLLSKEEADGLCAILDLYDPAKGAKEYLSLTPAMFKNTVYDVYDLSGKKIGERNSYLATIIYLNNIYSVFDAPNGSDGIFNQIKATPAPPAFIVETEKWNALQNSIPFMNINDLFIYDGNGNGVSFVDHAGGVQELMTNLEPLLKYIPL